MPYHRHVPTVLDALASSLLRYPRRDPSADGGVSLVSTFDDAMAPSKHTTQYYEMLGSSLNLPYGWRAVCPWPGVSFIESGRKIWDAITYDNLTELDGKAGALQCCR